MNSGRPLPYFNCLQIIYCLCLMKRGISFLMGLQIPRWIVYIITARVRRFVPRRYHSRWARRLRQQFGFEREDAHQLALATFGSDKQGTVLGGNWFVTFDRRLISRFYNQHSQIDATLRRMTEQIRPPYSQAILPELAIPGEILSVS